MNKNNKVINVKRSRSNMRPLAYNHIILWFVLLDKVKTNFFLLF